MGRRTVRVDLSNKSATITENGQPVETYAPGVTRGNVREVIGRGGWSIPDGARGELMSPPDGFEFPVERA